MGTPCSCISLADSDIGVITLCGYLHGTVGELHEVSERREPLNGIAPVVAAHLAGAELSVVLERKDSRWVDSGRECGVAQNIRGP